MNDQLFWELIENSWADSPKMNKLRLKVLASGDADDIEELVIGIEDVIITKFVKRLKKLDKANMTLFIHLLEEKLNHIDRPEIQKYTNGGDDGFLYSRCFIVAMGLEYYSEVEKNPSKAFADAEAEMFGFIVYDVYEEKFGEEFERNSIHNTQTGSSQFWP
jgi:hypothetical protein